MIKYLHVEPFAPFDPCSKVIDDAIPATSILNSGEAFLDVLRVTGLSHENARFSVTVPRCLVALLSTCRDVFHFAHYLGAGVVDDEEFLLTKETSKRLSRKHAARCASFHAKRTLTLLGEKIDSILGPNCDGVTLAQVCQLAANAEALDIASEGIMRLVTSWDRMMGLRELKTMHHRLEASQIPVPFPVIAQTRSVPHFKASVNPSMQFF